MKPATSNTKSVLKPGSASAAKKPLGGLTPTNMPVRSTAASRISAPRSTVAKPASAAAAPRPAAAPKPAPAPNAVPSRPAAAQPAAAVAHAPAPAPKPAPAPAPKPAPAPAPKPAAAPKPAPAASKPAAKQVSPAASPQAAAHPAETPAPAPKKKSKAGIIVGIAAIALLGGGAAYVCTQPELMEAITGPEEVIITLWKDGIAAGGSNAQGQVTSLTDLSKEKVTAFAADEANWMAMMRYMLTKADADSSANAEKQIKDQTEKIEKLKKQIEDKRCLMLSLADSSKESKDMLADLNKQVADAQVELNAPWTLEKAIEKPELLDLLNKITTDREWLEQITLSGELANPGRMLAILGEIMKKHPECMQPGVLRDVATATAVEYALNNAAFALAEPRAEHYIRNWKEGRLNTVFDTLPFWQRRMVCGCKPTHNGCTPEALQWAVDNVHLPAERYCGACWYSSYRLINVYGESIHGSGYGEPFKGVFGDNHYTFTQTVGGVCGSLSHYGAYSACANGVPAMTAGEPGHCAFIVLVNGKWTPSYSLSWRRGLHWTVWKDMHRYSSLHMQTEMMSEKSAKRTRLSNAYRMIANAYGSNSTENAIKAYRAAVTLQPRNYIAWREYADLLKSTKGNPEAWAKYNSLVCDKLEDEYPEMAAEILKGFAYPVMKEAASGFGKQKLMENFLTFWKSIARSSRGKEKITPDTWDVEELMGQQLEILKKLGGDEKEMALDYYKQVLSNTFASKLYAPMVLAWGNNMAQKYKGDMTKRVMEANVVALSSTGGAKLDAKSQDAMIGSLLVQCENARDINSFNNLANLLSKEYTQPKDKMPSFQPCAGRLVSERAVPFFSSVSSRFGQPSGAGHPGLVKECGGSFHTDKDNPAWAAVLLERPAMVSGVVVVCNTHNTHRVKDIHIQVSEDGENWTDVGPAPVSYTGEVMRFEMGSEDQWPRAKYVRVIRDGGPEFFHLRGIYVYGKKTA